jgi:glycosyltransferase involved in cell wall biosynthesis
MRFLFLSFIPDNSWSGMGKWTHAVAGELRQLGHDVDLRFSDDFPRLARSGRLAVLLAPPFLAAWIARKRRQWDAVVIHEPLGFWYGAIRRLSSELPPMLLMCHNVESRHFDDMVRASAAGAATVTLGGRIRNRLVRRWQSDGAIRAADLVLCLSSVDERYLMRQNPRIVRLVNGVHRSRMERPAGRRSVLFVGGWLDVKGRRLLPQIWNLVRREIDDAELTLVGTGASEEEVVADFVSGDRHSLRVVPRVHSAEEMDEIYSSHGVFLMPSLSEGSPLALLEAMGHGLAVAAARVGGIPDIAADGEHALLFEPMDIRSVSSAVVRLLTDAGLRSRIGESAVIRAGSLTWRATAEAIADAAVVARGAVS